MNKKQILLSDVVRRAMAELWHEGLHPDIYQAQR